MNWGHKITIFFSAFVALIIALVVMSMRQDVSLVTQDYYAQEIVYGQQMDKIRNARQPGQGLDFKYDAATQQARFALAADAETPVTGTLQFFRPADATLDFDVPLQPDQSGQQTVDLSRRATGLWKVKASWQRDEQEFYAEYTLTR